jgi:hypothetical protein
MDEVTLGHVVFEIYHFSPANIFTVTTHTHPHLNTAVSRKYVEAEEASKCILFLRRRRAGKNSTFTFKHNSQRIKR